MDEIGKVMDKYDASYVREKLVSAQDANEFATTFYKDVAEIYDCITRTKNTERNPSGFSLDESKRAKLLQVHAVITCLREVLLYAEDDDAATYAEAANVAIETLERKQG